MVVGLISLVILSVGLLLRFDIWLSSRKKRKVGRFKKLLAGALVAIGLIALVISIASILWIFSEM